MTTAAVTLTPDTPSVVSWKQQLKDRPVVLTEHRGGEPTEVDASHMYACQLILDERYNAVYHKREDALLKLARLILWLDWIDTVVGEQINHHITDGLAHERDELIRQVASYTDVLDRIEF
jgi:hypothetical protein